MALEKQVILGVVSILPDMRIELREDSIILEDGKELSKSYHRSVAIPGDDVSTKPQLIKDLAALLWTPEIIAAEQAKKAAELEKILASLPKTPVT
jgi:hypothetical protein